MGVPPYARRPDDRLGNASIIACAVVEILSFSSLHGYSNPVSC